MNYRLTLDYSLIYPPPDYSLLLLSQICFDFFFFYFPSLITLFLFFFLF